MRLLLTSVCILLAFCVVSPATTIQDPFHVAPDNCNLLSCDVIGLQANFDIQKADVSLTATSIDVTLYFNYGGGSSLSPFGNPSVQVGDLFFYDPAIPQIKFGTDAYYQYLFGVPLTSHNGMTAGQLYKIVDPTKVETAAQVLGNPANLTYRTTQPVWMPSGEQSVGTGHGVVVQNYGNGTSNALYEATIHITTTGAAQFLNLFKAGQIGVVFESATCANDVLQGLTGVPEPGAMSMMALGFGMLAGVGAWRRRQRNRK